MFLFTIAFLIGDLYLQTVSHLLPTLRLIEIMAGAFIFWFLLCRRLKYSYLLLVIALGFSWSSWVAQQRLANQLPRQLEGQPLLITGHIVSLPILNNGQIQFLFLTNHLMVNQRHFTPHWLLRLNWQGEPALMSQLKPGDEYQWSVKLKRIHGIQGPGAYDFEAFALQAGFSATGYIVASEHNQFIAHHWYNDSIDQLRQLFQKKLFLHLPNTSNAPKLLALMIGDRSQFSADDWDILRNTGTNHLLAIAGLHLGVIAGLFHGIVDWLWRRSTRLMLWLPATQAAKIAALLMALFYGTLTNFSLPAERANLMLILLVGTALLKIKMNAWSIWACALFIVLLINPLSPLSQSFWLSFGTIGLIIYGMTARLAPKGMWWQWGRVQWVISVGLIPISLMLFQEISLLAFVANMIAIPWVALLILPCCFVGSLLLFIIPSVGDLFLVIADKGMSGLWWVLSYIANDTFATKWLAIPNTPILGLTLLGFLFLLLPKGAPGRWFGVIWMLPLLLFKPAVPAVGDMWLTLLDVGQGLSAVIQTQSHLLVYDTGPKYNDSFDMGKEVLLPFLRTLRIASLDELVISHGDNDHIGGAQALLQAMPPQLIATSVPEKLTFPTVKACLAGETWTWDQVQFTFLYPTPEMLHLNNDSSCVLKIDNGTQHILLTGDIEKLAENNLLKRIPDQLATTILIAPHHGSKTSGLEKFIEKTHPQVVLYATGYRNRYHFPNEKVVAAYQNIQAEQYNTALAGTIQFKLEKNQSISLPSCYRKTHQRYWMD